VHIKNEIRWVMSAAMDEQALMDALVRERHFLADGDPNEIDTTLLIHP
jgi:uncharacterized protein